MFKLKKIHIQNWRKLHGLELDIGNRLTLISGHNGVGKSNLLSIIASGSGKKESQNKFLLKTNFHPEFDSYFYIDESELSKQYSVILEYIDEDKYTVYKELRLKNDTNSKRGIRIIPTLIDYDEKFESKKLFKEEMKKRFNIGYEARIAIPTVFLSISRLHPLKESNAETKEMKPVSKDFLKQYIEWYNKVLPHSIKLDANEILQINKSLTVSDSYYMPISNTLPLTQSVGQDNLGTIISTLLNFYELSQRDDYNGGLLCIDEVDVPLHPDAQERLVELLDIVSKKLKLQIIISSHSLVIIREILKLRERKETDYAVGYLISNEVPYFKQNLSYDAIKRDLYLKTNINRPKLKIYFEDEIAAKVYDILMNTVNILASDKIEKFDKYNSLISNLTQTETIGVHLGCENLIKLSQNDNYFKTVLMILDGDASQKEGKFKWENVSNYLKSKNNKLPELEHEDRELPKNALCLPGILPPELYLYRIINHYIEYEEEYKSFWRGLEEIEDLVLNTAQFVRDRIIITGELNKTNIKQKGKEICDFVEQSNILVDYYRRTENRDELVTFLKNLSCKIEPLMNQLRGRLYQD